MNIQISKYNASGNDFAIFQSKDNKDRSNLAKKICDRHRGIGADGLIVVITTQKQEYDFVWEFYNSDGSFANMCGNGSRAVCMFAYQNKIIGTNMKFKSGAGIIEGDICSLKLNQAEVEVMLTRPKMLATSFMENGLEWSFYDTGVPHLVSFVSDLSNFCQDMARKMRRKYNANVNFAKFENHILYVRTYERGVEDETMACGTGMAAAFIAGVDKFGLEKNLKVIPKSGEMLFLRLDNEKIYFKGMVTHSFDATYFDN